MTRAATRMDLDSAIASRDGLERLARMAPDALGIDSAEDFLVAFAHRLSEIAPFVSDAALVERDPGARLAWSRILVGTGRFEEEVGRPVFDLLDDEGAEALGRALFDDVGHDSSTIRAIPLGESDRSTVVLYLESSHALEANESRVLDVVSVAVSAILANIHVRQRLMRAANLDESTGLATRMAFERHVSESAADDPRVVLVEIERLSDISDMLGQSTADGIVAATAQRLAEHLPGRAPIGRVATSRIAVLVESSDADLSGIESAFSEALRTPAVELAIRPRIGIAARSTSIDSNVDLLSAAGVALSSARRHGTSSAIFEPGMASDARARLVRIDELRGALDRNEFELHFQPQIDLGTGKVVGAEALVRWRRADGSLVMPLQFIDVAEQSGLIVPLGEWVLREACHHATLWERHGLGHIRVAVNVSAEQFRGPDFVDLVSRTLFEFALAPERLELELTESIDLGSFPLARGTMERIADLGVRWALDDFGVGYSSFEYLRTLPVSRLKIDRSFTSEIVSLHEGTAIPRTLIGLATTFGIETTAEGVESEYVAEILTELGCIEAQGYLYATPLAAGEFVRFAKAHNGGVSGVSGVAASPESSRKRSVA